MGVFTHIQGVSEHRGAQIYRGVSKPIGASKHTGGVQTWGHPNIQTEVILTYGASKHTGGIQTYWGCPNIQGIHPNI